MKYVYKYKKEHFQKIKTMGMKKNIYSQQRVAPMTAKGQQELELSGVNFRRNFITLTSDQHQERICFHTDGG